MIARKWLLTGIAGVCLIAPGFAAAQSTVGDSHGQSFPVNFMGGQYNVTPLVLSASNPVAPLQMDASANLKVVDTNSAGILNALTGGDLIVGPSAITVVDSGTASTTGFNGQALITGTPTPSSFLGAAAGGLSSAITGVPTITATALGTWTGTWQGECATDNPPATFTPITPSQIGATNSAASITANGSFRFVTQGCTGFRVRATSAMTGSLTMTLTKTAVPFTSASSGGGGGAVTQSGLWSVTNPNQATASVAINVSTATTTQLVALSSGKAIYVSAWDIAVLAADNITLEYGTGSNCGTGTTALTGAYNFSAGSGIAKGSGIAPLLFVPASNALCILTSAATQASGSLSYAQF